MIKLSKEDYVAYSELRQNKLFKGAKPLCMYCGEPIKTLTMLKQYLCTNKDCEGTKLLGKGLRIPSEIYDGDLETQEKARAITKSIKNQANQRINKEATKNIKQVLSGATQRRKHGSI